MDTVLVELFLFYCICLVIYLVIGSQSVTRAPSAVQTASLQLFMCVYGNAVFQTSHFPCRYSHVPTTNTLSDFLNFVF